MIKRDTSALEGFPYQLMIISAVIALTLPVVYSTWEYYDTQSTLQNVRDEVEFIGQKAEQLFVRGEGNSDEIELNLEDGMFTDVRHVKFGKESSPYQRIDWKVGDNHEGTSMLPRNIPLVPYEDGERVDEMVLRGGRHILTLTCKMGVLEGNRTLYIQVSER